MNNTNEKYVPITSMLQVLVLSGALLCNQPASAQNVNPLSPDHATATHPMQQGGNQVAGQGQLTPVSANGSNFVGAELTGNVIAPGKVKITLRTFYTAAQATVPETEMVNVIGGKPANTVKGTELKKEVEYIDVKYPFVAGKDNFPPAVKIVTYSATADLSALHTSYDFVWMAAATPTILNNIEISSGDAISLTAHIDDAMKAINNTPPVVDHLPAYKVSSTTTTKGQINVHDNDGLDKVELLLTSPMIYHPGEKGAAQEKAIAFKGGKISEANYRKGFSAAKPMAAACAYNKENNEFVFEQPAFGNYVCAITITDYRNKEALSRHQAIFIITSVL